jgi:hypothetical protein
MTFCVARHRMWRWPAVRSAVGGGRRYATSCSTARARAGAAMMGRCGCAAGPDEYCRARNVPHWLPAPYRGHLGAATADAGAGERIRAHVRTRGGANDSCGGPTRTDRGRPSPAGDKRWPRWPGRAGPTGVAITAAAPPAIARNFG